MSLSVIIPVYNEVQTIIKLSKNLEINIQLNEIIIVDDYSNMERMKPCRVWE